MTAPLTITNYKEFDEIMRFLIQDAERNRSVTFSLSLYEVEIDIFANKGICILWFNKATKREKVVWSQEKSPSIFEEILLFGTPRLKEDEKKRKK